MAVSFIGGVSRENHQPIAIQNRQDVIKNICF